MIVMGLKLLTYHKKESTKKYSLLIVGIGGCDHAVNRRYFPDWIFSLSNRSIRRSALKKRNFWNHVLELLLYLHHHSAWLDLVSVAVSRSRKHVSGA